MSNQVNVAGSVRFSNPTERPTELRARCGCRFEPYSEEPESDSGHLVLTYICVPHSQGRTRRIQSEDNEA